MNNIEPANPYQSPQASVYQTPQPARDHELVSGWRRLGTHLVDIIGFYIVFFLLVMVVVITLGEGWLDLMDGIAGNLIALATMMVYYIGFETAFARTPGKFVFGTIVVDENGNKPTVGQFIGRSFARLIPFEALSCIGSRSRGWHDSLSKTYVVKAT